jgi:uncharacterized metal-binding protein YceD (DUF177 family)
VTRPEFVVAVADLESGPKVVDFTIPESWLRAVLQGTQAETRGQGRLRAELSKNGREVLVRGSAEVSVTLPCVVTMDPLPFDLRPEILLLLSPGPPAATTAPRGKGANKKKSKKAWSDEPELSRGEAGRDTFSGDQVVLDDFVREFILLELPMYPRRSDLPSPGDAASHPAPEPAGSKVGQSALGAAAADKVGQSALGAAAADRIDPRLRPLAEIAQRLASKKAKE